MGRLNPTPFWDDLGCGGIPREGEGLWVDLHHVKSLAHNVDRRNAGSENVRSGIEKIEFPALNHVDYVPVGYGLESGDIEILAEGRFLGKRSRGTDGIEDAQAASDSIGR